MIDQQTINDAASIPPELGGPSGVTDLATVAGVTPTPVVVAPDLTVSDADNATELSATVSITGGFNPGEDVLAFNNDGATMGDVAGSYDAATGVLTLTSAGATATLAEWQAALESVTYTDGAASPTAGDRTISFTINDGVTDSATITQSVHVTIDQPPELGLRSGVTDLATVAGVTPTPVVVAPVLTVWDADNTTEASATVSITDGFHPGEDVLAFNNDGATMGDIASSYDAATGVLTLTSAATATLTEWQAALESVTYTDSAVSPTAGDRTISFTINDGVTDSDAVTQTVHVTVDQPPTLDGVSGVTDLAIVAGVTPTPVAVAIAPVLTVSDADNTTEVSATVSITGGFHPGEDVLAFRNDGATMGDIAGSYDAATGVLTLTSDFTRTFAGVATLAEWQAALQSVTYTDTAASPTAGDRTISFTINDGAALFSANYADSDSETVTQTVHVTVDQPPELGGLSGVTNLATLPGVTPTPVAVAPALTVSDVDNTTEASATVSITGGFQAGEDVLAFNNDGGTMGDIAGSYDAAAGVLTLTSAGASATLAEWQAALATVTYTDSAASLTVGDRTISFTINDGLANSATVTQTVHVTIDQPPELGGISGVTNLATVAGVTPTPVAVAPALTVSDVDNTTEASATVSITGGFHPGEDVLAFNNDGATMGDVTGSFDAATGVLTLTSAGASATLAEWQAALQSVTYTDGAASPMAGDRTVSFTINDGLADSEPVTQTVHETVTRVSRPPGGGGGGGGYEPPKHTFVFETMTSADAASYNAGSDQIVFSNPAAHATAIQVVFTPSATTAGTISSAVITDLTTGHSLTFGALIMGENDFVFPDSSKLVVGTAGADATLTNLSTFTGGVAMFGSFGDDELNAGAGPAVLQSNQGDDTLVGGAGSDTLFGGQGNDYVDATQSTGHNLVNGNLGDDTLIGGAGGDTLRGGQGDDMIHGGSGHDWLSGDRGDNTLTGGAGPDIFHASLGNDVVTDFYATEGDRVQLDLGTVYTANQVGADVELDLAGGGRMVLQNVQLSALRPGWIFEA